MALSGGGLTCSEASSSISVVMGVSLTTEFLELNMGVEFEVGVVLAPDGETFCVDDLRLALAIVPR